MKYKKLIIGLISGLLVITVCVLNAIYVNPHKLEIREETLKSNKITASQDGMIIAYFTDLHFGYYTLEDDLNKVVNTINSANPDIVIFGGDLVDQASNRGLSETNKQILIDALSSIDSKYGKYCVLGNHDEDFQITKDIISSILITSGFEILDNTNKKIYTENNDCLNLIGVDSIVYGTPDIEAAYQNLNDSAYSILVSHCPDIFDSIDFSKTDYVLAGHSHGGQVYFPLINLFYRRYGAEKYFKGKHIKNNVTLDISNGVGLSEKSIRFLADAEVVFYKLEAN